MKKKQTITSLKRKAWTVFVNYIKRTRPHICCTCGKEVEGRDCQGGHYYSKRFYPSLYFDETNVQIQCAMCNIFREGEKQKFREFLLKEYGEAELQRLDFEREKEFKFTVDYLQKLISKYEYIK